MKLNILLTTAQAKVTAGLFTDLAAGWFLGVFAVEDAFRLTGNVLLGIVCLKIAVEPEELSNV